MYSSGTCECGLISIGIDMKPLMTYNCHCSHCRTFGNKYISNNKQNSNPKLFHSACCVFQWNVVLSNNELLEYDHTTSLFGLFALNRGRCSNCKQPIVEYGERCILPFVMVMTENILIKPNIIQPTIDFYYNSGPLYINNKKKNQKLTFLQPSCSTIQTIIQTDIGSLLYEIYLIITVAIPLIPWSIYKRLMRTTNKQSNKQN